MVGVDISGMLDIGRTKVSRAGQNGRVELVLGDGESLPFEDNRFDAFTVAFGVRNFENLTAGLREMQRTWRPVEKGYILEFSSRVCSDETAVLAVFPLHHAHGRQVVLQRRLRLHLPAGIRQGLPRKVKTTHPARLRLQRLHPPSADRRHRHALRRRQRHESGRSPSALSRPADRTASKSHMQRLVAAALLAEGESWVRNPSDAADCWAALSVAAGLGADIEVGSDSIRIEGGLHPRTDALEIGKAAWASACSPPSPPFTMPP